MLEIVQTINELETLWMRYICRMKTWIRPSMTRLRVHLKIVATDPILWLQLFGNLKSTAKIALELYTLFYIFVLQESKFTEFDEDMRIARNTFK